MSFICNMFIFMVELTFVEHVGMLIVTLVKHSYFDLIHFLVNLNFVLIMKATSFRKLELNFFTIFLYFIYLT